jgi:tight adherence protein C
MTSPSHFASFIHANQLTVGLGCAAVVVCTIALALNLSRQGRTAAAIKAIHERRRELRGEMVKPKKRKRPETSVNFMRAVAVKLQLIKKSQVGNAESMLIEAGFRSKDAIFVLAFFNLILPITFCVVGLIVSKLNAHVSPRWHTFNYVWPVLGAYIGLKVPGIYVRRVRKKRYLRIQRSLADVLDLMTVCSEAGLSLAAMFARVSKELMISYPEMAEELSMTSVEIGFLPERSMALRNMAERCKLPEIRGMMSVLIQTEKYGTPIAQALRVLSTEFRQSRMLRAEHKAAKLPALMTVPMILFILPTLFIVIIAPAAVKLMNTIASN